MKTNYLTIAFLLFFSFKSTAQNDKIKHQDHFYKNRWEALLSKNVSASFRILSFVSSKPKMYKATDTLQVHFFIVDDSVKTRINASKIIQDSGNYQMLVEKEDWEKGWNIFKPWPVKDVISKYDIKAKNLGLLIKGNNRILIPASITKTSEKKVKDINNYVVHFFTPANINKLNYSILNQSTNSVLDEGNIEDIDATSSFRLRFNMKNKVNGIYKLLLKIEWISGMKTSKIYSFYHFNK